jgi:hypothetical protein
MVRHCCWVVVTHGHHYVLTWHAVAHVMRVRAAHVTARWPLHHAARVPEVIHVVVAAAAAAAALASVLLPAVLLPLLLLLAAAAALLLLAVAGAAILWLAWRQVWVVKLAGVAESAPAVAHVECTVWLLRPQRQASAAADQHNAG